MIAAIAWILLNRAPAKAKLISNTQLTRAAGMEEFPAISPDGKSVAYRAFGPADSVPHVEYRRTDGGDAVQIAGGKVPMGWSPTGDRLLVSGPDGLQSRPALGGQGTVIDPRAFTGGWSPDGKQVAYVLRDSLMVGGLDEAQPRFITKALDPHSPVWSPDGKWIAFVSGNPAYLTTYNIAPSSIWLVPAAGGTPVQLTATGGMNISPTWAPDSRRLLFVSTLAGVRDVYQLTLTSAGRPRGAPVRISTGLNPSLISLSADGSQLAYSVASYHANIWKLPIPTSGSISTVGALPVTNDLQTIEALDISQDGKWLAFDSDREGAQQIFRMPLGGGVVQRLTHGSSPSFRPRISPDGKELAFHTVLQGLRRVFIAPMDGGNSTQISPRAAPDERASSWSPDGRHLAWYSNTNSPPQVQLATRDDQGKWGPTVTVAFKGRLLFPSWADQGAGLIGIDSAGHFTLQPVDGGAFRLLNATDTVTSRRLGETTAALSSDGQVAYFISRDANVDRRNDGIVALRLADGELREVLRFDEPARPHSFASNGIAEHGGWIYFTLSDFQSDIWVATVDGLKR